MEDREQRERRFRRVMRRIVVIQNPALKNYLSAFLYILYSLISNPFVESVLANIIKREWRIESKENEDLREYCGDCCYSKSGFKGLFACLSLYPLFSNLFVNPFLANTIKREWRI
jgi:hypothetical protein